MKRNDTYFETQAEAMDYAFTNTFNRGYKIMNHDQFLEHVAYGTVVKYTYDLTKNDKPSRKCLHISLYRMPSGTYELTHYIN